ncbi:glycosyltransferase family 4 protein [Candidatus Sumerlaeota bacterium]|nr:glycosyltransferase family 4 protein [Candidatus Sumerlaeota bacterium]
MKIFFDARTVRRSMTGVGVYTRSLLKGLMHVDRENEYRCFILEEDAWENLSAPDNFQPYFGAPDYQHHPAGDIWMWFRLPGILRAEGADLFHGPAFLCPRCDSPPTVVTIHDLTVFAHPETYPVKFRKYMQWAIRRSVHGARSIIAVSGATQRDLNKLLNVPNDRVWIVWEAAGEQFQPQREADIQKFLQQKNLKQGYILAVGMIEPRKGIDNLVQAFRMLPVELQRKHPLVLIGDYGWKSDALNKLIEGEIREGGVRRISYVDAQELPLYYSGAAMLAYPSLYEGFGLPPLEAMASGTPVIVSNTSSMPEVVNDAGLLLSPGKPQRWATEIESLLTNESLRANLARHGRERSKHFSWDKAARDTLECYKATVKLH